MNPVIKALHSFFAFFDRVTSEMDMKTIVMIRQSYTFVIVLLSLIALFAGITLGRMAADKGGVPIVTETRDVFDIDITREKERVSFSQMVEETEVFEKKSMSPSRAEPDESFPSFRSENGNVLDKDAAESVSIIEPSESDTMNTPIEREAEITEKEELPSIGSERDSEVIIREDEMTINESTGEQASQAENLEEESWQPGTGNGDAEQNLVPLDRAGGIVE